MSGRIAAVALLLLVCCGSAAWAGRNHAAKPATAPATTAGLTAHVPISGIDTALGAGQQVPFGGDAPTTGVTFTMPSFSCASSDDAEWLLPGIWIFDTNGNLVAQVDVNFNCNSGVKVQQSVICIAANPCDTSLHPAPGDVIEAAFTHSDTSAAGVIYDRTQHARVVISEAAEPQYYSYSFVGDAGPSAFGVPAVPTFTKVAFSIATINGQYIGDFSPIQRNLKTYADVQIKSSAAKTTSFTTRFVHN